VTVNYSGYLSSGSSDEEVNEHLARDTQLMKTAKAKSYARKLSEGDWTEGFWEQQADVIHMEQDRPHHMISWALHLLDSFAT
jgi:hypothetical protein